MTTGVTPVTVVVVNYNAGTILRQCIESCLRQGEQVVLVDNASEDGSVVGVLDAVPEGERFRVIRNRVNLGFAAACNQGVALSEGDVLFLNPDCVLGEGALARMHQVLRGADDVGMVGGLLLNPDGSEQGGGRRAMPTPWRSFVRAFGLHRLAGIFPRLFADLHLNEQPLPDEPTEVEAISGACMLVRREALDQVGLLDEGYFMHCEDLDWCMRFRRAGRRILFVPDAEVMHLKGACSKSRPLFVEWHKHKGMRRFYRRFYRDQYPGALMWLVDAGVWLRFIVVALVKQGKRLVEGLRG